MRLHRFEFRAMASTHELLLAAPDRAHAERAARSAIADVERVEAKYSRYRDTSVVSAINRAFGSSTARTQCSAAIRLRPPAMWRASNRCRRTSSAPLR